MAEELTDFLGEHGVRVRYLHSDVDTLRRVELLTELRAGRLRRARRHQPAARGSRPARGVAGRDPRRRQGGLPPQRHLAHPDHRPRRAQRLGRGAHVRRHPHRLDEATRSRRPTGAARSRSRTTSRTASTRSRCASASPTSPRCWRAKAPTRRHAARADRDAKSARQVADPATCAGRESPPRAPTSSRPSIADLNDQMLAAAGELKFELAARLRDEVQDLKKELRAMERAGATPEPMPCRALGGLVRRV